MQKSRLRTNMLDCPPLPASSPVWSPGARALKPVSFHGVLWPTLMGLVLEIIGYAMQVSAYSEGYYRRSEVEAGVALVGLGVVAMICGGIYGCVVIYRAWTALQGSVARTTPGKAVGFLFIPFFNLYWIFQCYYGWSKDYNAHLAVQGIDRSDKRTSEGLFLASCILSLCGIFPPVAIVGLVFVLITFSQMCRGVNYLAEGK